MGIAFSIEVGQAGKLSEYRQRAEECRSLAYDLSNDSARRELLELAEIWTLLAEARAPLPQ